MEFKPSTVHVLLILQIIFLPSSVLGLKVCNFPAIFNFGDSNSDTGGLSAAFGQLPPPFGRTFFRAPAGRYSDGRLIIDFMAESLGLPHLSAFLDSIGSNFSHGANFATGSSTIRPQDSTLPLGVFSPFSIGVQHVQYSDLLKRAQFFREQEFHRQLLPENDVFGRALYTFDIGQNDLNAAYYFTNLTFDEVKATVPDILTPFSDVIKLLYGQGGRSFWIHNNGPMGCLAANIVRVAATETRFDEYGCFIPYNDVSQYFNLKLKETVLQLREELPEAAITYVDVYSIKYNLVRQTKQLGFKDPLQVCCGQEGGKYNFNKNFFCGQSKVVNGTLTYAKSCKDPSLHINWDGGHLSEAANKWIFDQMVYGSFSDPPVPLKFACNNMDPSVAVE